MPLHPCIPTHVFVHTCSYLGGEKVLGRRQIGDPPADAAEELREDDAEHQPIVSAPQPDISHADDHGADEQRVENGGDIVPQRVRAKYGVGEAGDDEARVEDPRRVVNVVELGLWDATKALPRRLRVVLNIHHKVHNDRDPHHHEDRTPQLARRGALDEGRSEGGTVARDDHLRLGSFRLGTGASRGEATRGG